MQATELTEHTEMKQVLSIFSDRGPGKDAIYRNRVFSP